MKSRILEGFHLAFQGSSRKRIVKNLLLALAIGALSAWFLMMFSSVTAYMSSVDGPEMALNRAYPAHSLTFLVCAVCMIRFRNNFRSVYENNALCLPLTALLAIGTIILAYSSLSESIIWLLVITGALLTAGAVGVLLATIGHRFGEMSYRERLIFTLVGFAFTSLLFTLFSFYVMETALVITVATALLAGISLFASGLKFFEEPDNKQEKNNEGSAVEQVDTEQASSRHILLRFCVLVFLWRFIIEAVRIILVNGGINEAGSTVFAEIHAIVTALIVLLTLVLIVSMLSKPRTFRLSYAYRAILLISICSALTSLVAFDRTMRIVPYALTSCSTILLMMMAWLVAVLSFELVPKYSASQTTLMVMVSSFSGSGLAFTLISNFDYLMVFDKTTLPIINTVLVCALVFIYLSLFKESDIDFISRLIPTKQHRRFASRCEEIAKQYNLSAREAEILLYLAKGHNASYIQEELFISYNTATTHRKRIYQKLNIHSQQELMKLVSSDAMLPKVQD